MKLNNKDLSILCNTAILAAKNAGTLINEYAYRKVSIHSKKGADSLASQVVTEVDLKAQEIILNTLAQTITDYDLALLTEESVDDKSRFEKDYFWCIDPMDGTLAFTEKTPGYAVSIGLVSKSGVPQIGVVFDPVTQTLYHAIKGEGAFKNELPWAPNLLPKNSNVFSLFVDRSFIKKKNYEFVKKELNQYLLSIGINEMQTTEFAGAVLNACWVLDNAPACYFKFPKPETGGGSLWDFAATTCIYSELGAFVSDLSKNPLGLNQPETTFMNKKGVLFASDKEIRNKIIELHKMLP